MEDVNEKMRKLEMELVGGHEHCVLHLLELDGAEPDVVMFIMDAEYDPVRVTYDPGGGISIHADGHKYHMFTAHQLEFIAEKAEEAKDMWKEYFKKYPAY